MNIEKIKKYFEENKYPLYRYQQVKDFISNNPVSSFKEITTLPRSLREEIEKRFNFFSIKNLGTLASSDKKAFKFLFELNDRYKIETMIFEKSKGLWVCCVSTQVGCAVGCKFCQSGKKGLKRNLDWEEIFDQVLFVRNYIINKGQGNLKRIVYMGIGEPLLNYNNTIKSINFINKYLGIGKRHISVSTFGYIPGIRNLARDLGQVNLAISLHSAVEEVRNDLVPMGINYPLSKLSDALKDYLVITNRKVFIEYVMLKGINDRIKDAYNIIKFIDSISKRKYFVVNLIPYNPTDSNFTPSSTQRIEEFRSILIAEGVDSTIRKSYGKEIKGGCGQLAV